MQLGVWGQVTITVPSTNTVCEACLQPFLHLFFLSDSHTPLRGLTAIFFMTPVWILQFDRSFSLCSNPTDMPVQEMKPLTSAPTESPLTSAPTESALTSAPTESAPTMSGTSPGLSLTFLNDLFWYPVVPTFKCLTKGQGRNQFGLMTRVY